MEKGLNEGYGIEFQISEMVRVISNAISLAGRHDIVERRAEIITIASSLVKLNIPLHHEIIKHIVAFDISSPSLAVTQGFLRLALDGNESGSITTTRSADGEFNRVVIKRGTSSYFKDNIVYTAVFLNDQLIEEPTSYNWSNVGLSHPDISDGSTFNIVFTGVNK